MHGETANAPWRFRSLKDLADDETLLIQSGKPVGIFKSHPDAPRVLLADDYAGGGQPVPNPAVTAVIAVAVFSGETETIRSRILGNTGGDRTGREDDGERLFRKKMMLYESRTRPLEAYYAKSVPVVKLTVSLRASPEDQAALIEEAMRA